MNLQEVEKFAREKHIPVLLDDSAQFLFNFVKEKQFDNILEIGTAIGYSGSIMLFANPKTKLTTIELNEESYNKAISNFASFGLSSRVTQFLGDAKNVIEELRAQGQKYDMIFLDGPKGQYLSYYPILLEMLIENGCLLVDNVFLHGMVRSTEDVGHKKRAMVTKLRKFYEEITTRSDLKTTIHELGDGVAEIYKKLKNN